MTQVDLRVIKTKDALHEALMTLLNEKNLEKISVTEICRLAKVNRGTFYLHYGRIEDVFAEYFREITADLAASYEEPYKRVVKLDVKKLDPSTIRIFHHVAKYKPFYHIVFSKQVPLMYYYLLFEEIKGLFMKDRVTELKDEVIDRELYCAYQANAIIGIILHWYQHDFSFSVDYLNNQLVRVLNMER